jgi:hypothetical protein
MRGEGRKPRSDLPWLSLICCFFCYGIAWFHVWRRAKTSFGIGLILLDLCVFCYGWRAWRGRNLVRKRLDFAWFLLFNCCRGVLLSYRGVSFPYRSPWLSYLL